MDTVRWIDMVDPVYTLVRLVGLDPDATDLHSISIMDQHLIVRYFEDGIQKFINLPYA